MVNQECDFKIKTINSDFRVIEVPLLPDFDSLPKSFTYVWLEKSNYTTFEALKQLKEFYGLDFSDVVAEGLKDEDGITEQIISIKKKLTKKAVEDFNRAHKGDDTFIVIEKIMGYGADPVMAKALHGNAFRVVVRNLTDEEAMKISEFTAKHKFFSFVNYYDNQRFGLPGGPYVTHLVGKAICEGDWDGAFALMQKTGNEIPEGKTGKAAFEAVNPGQVGFYVSAYNSFLWNNGVSEFLSKNFKSKTYDFPNVGKLNLPISTESTPNGVFTVDGFRFDFESFSAYQADFGRNIILPTTVYASQLKDDELFVGKKRILLSFFINTGCYATMMVKQVIKAALEENNG